MNQELKSKWLEALRSGRYDQGTGSLRVKLPDDGIDRYCCLGVLCDITNSSLWDKRIGPGRMTFEGSFNYLPQWVRDHAGVSDAVQANLSKMNDGGQTFEQIADYIEDNL